MTPGIPHMGMGGNLPMNMGMFNPLSTLQPNMHPMGMPMMNLQQNYNVQ